ncbi:hypothetical protein LBW89_25155 [Paenibacillus sp. alder61]|uniref:Uncharacterized protein n=1 Tax=Paenibacillus faecis TaxID=862114 RepID=A0A5D0CZ54_9BACL|nr:MULTISPECIES: hypothetical protein [Paenibacillus]MCA1296303.1 hypothetical protein [Paenibacillus sp. alder61]TYA14137.1 hypothetical protein FRY98_00145 [Paenibacillus faecis]
MIEMRKGDSLNYSNQIPGWAKIAHLVIFFFLALLSLGGFGLGAYLLWTGLWGGALLSLVTGAVISWAAWFTWKNSKLYTDHRFETGLNDEGFFSYYKDLKQGTERKHLIPYGSMREVLIARKTRYLPTGGNRPGSYRIGAQMIIQWEDKRGETDYAFFGMENKEEVIQWVGRFLSQGVTVMTSTANVSLAAPADYQTGYGQLEKQSYAGEADLNDIGTITRKDLPAWRSPEMEQARELKRQQHDKKWFKPLYLVLLMVNLLIAALWMPNWEVAEDVFSENSPSFTFILINTVALFIFGRYWRATRRWFRPLVDTLLIYAVQALGLAVSGLFRKSTAMYYEAAWIDTLTVGVFICLSFAAAQLAARVRKARRARNERHSAGG